MGKKRVLPVALLCGALCLFLVLSISGCYEPGGPVPEGKSAPAPRAWTTEQVDAMVRMDNQAIYSPAPRDNGTPPAECDNINFLRFRLKESSGNPADADAVLVLMPGLLSGANAFEYLGRQMVYMAKTQRNVNLEVWATERRGNLLEDVTGLNAAEAAGNTQAAIDYYYNGAEVNGRKFTGFLGNNDVPYLSEFGLKLEMEDVYKIITTMLPDPEMRRRKLFVGGHSLGGPLTAFFAGWDFDGDPATTDDAGYRNCAGLVALDSSIATSIGATQSMATVNEVLPESLKSAASDAMTPEEDFYARMIEQLRSGAVPRILPFPAITPEAMALLELAGMEADRDPDGEADLFKRIPYSADVENMLKLIHSRDMENYFVWLPGIKDFRYTNEALLGVILDDNSMPIGIIQSSMGFLNGGAVVRKDFPLPAGLAEAPLLQDMLGGFLSTTKLYIANDAGPSYDKLGTGPLYTWANFDEVGSAQDPDYKSEDGSLTYTDTSNEVSDIQDVARMLYHGPANLTEWYFTMRIMLDVASAVQPFGPRYGLNFVHGDRVGDLPKIEFHAEQGLGQSSLSFVPGGTNDTLKGYNHLDVVTAAADRPTRRPNEVFSPLIDFMMSNVPAVAAPSVAAPQTNAAQPVPARKKPARKKRKI